MAALTPLRRDQIVNPNGQVDPDKLVRAVNEAISPLLGLLRHGLSLADHLACEIINIRLTTAAVLANTFPIYLSPFRIKSPAFIDLKRVREDAAVPTTITSALGLDWDTGADGRIRVKHITGLATGTTYDLSFLLWEA